MLLTVSHFGGRYLDLGMFRFKLQQKLVPLLIQQFKIQRN